MKKRIAWILVGLMMFMTGIAAAAEAEQAPGSRLKAMLEEWHKKDNKKDAGKGVQLNGRVGLVWQPTGEGDMSEQERLAGMNVVSPCWFRVTNADGTVGTGSFAPDKDYVKNAQKKGYQVWALVSNSFDPDMTHELLANASSSRHAVNEIIKIAKDYKLDGINLDFENIYEEDRDALSGFIAQLGTALHREGKVFSVDVTFPGGSGNWSLCYDRAAIAKAADYVMVMAYDQHPRGSSVAGSVAALDWVENGMQAMMREVSSDKLVLGMPLYTRLWEETNGTLTDVKTLWMADAQKLLQEKKTKRVWDADAGQYYFEYKEGGHTYRVWQEDARSLALKAALVSRYDLAGAALWRRGFETAEVWPVIAAELKNAEN